MGVLTSGKTDLYSLHNYIQNTLISSPKEIMVESLRKFFSQDSFYHYQKDQWGFPLTPDHTDLPIESGLNDNVTTRLFIGETFRKDVQYYPCLLVKHAGSRSVPISMNRDKGSIKWAPVKYIDGYGNESIINNPSYIIQAGAWEGSLAIDIKTRSSKSRDELSEIVAIFGVDSFNDILKDVGVFIKAVSISSPSEIEDRNDKIYLNTITFDIRTEWRREIPITNVLEVINICVDLGLFTSTGQNVAPNLTINTTIELIDNLINL